MRELNTKEVEMVSGAGIIADIGKGIGGAVGGFMDFASGIFGGKRDYTSGFKLLGEGIGQLFELKFVTGAGNITKGITGIVNAFGKKPAAK